MFSVFHVIFPDFSLTVNAFSFCQFSSPNGNPVTMPGWIPRLCPILPGHGGTLRFTSGATPVDILIVNMAAEHLLPIYVFKH